MTLGIAGRPRREVSIRGTSRGTARRETRRPERQQYVSLDARTVVAVVARQRDRRCEQCSPDIVVVIVVVIAVVG
jgi:hypothetical protein